MNRMHWLIASVLVAASLAAGCATRTGNFAAGAALVGGAYEYQNKRAIDELDRYYRSGRISGSEYQRRKRDVEKRSLIY